MIVKLAKRTSVTSRAKEYNNIKSIYMGIWAVGDRETSVLKGA